MPLPYRTAEELHIRHEEYSALIRVRNDLASGAIPPKLFDMAEISFPLMGQCGTVACIGGHMAIYMDVNPRSYLRMIDGHSVSLYNLFFPSVSDWDRITTAVAVRAIDSFLAGQKGFWELALEDDEAAA